MAFIKSLLTVLLCLTLLAPISGYAQYGGSTITFGGSSSTTTAPVFSSSVSGNSVNIGITSAKKGDVINVSITNSNNDVINISFTLDADVTNATITLSKIELSSVIAGLLGSPIAIYALSLTNINYDQINNFSFDFGINGLSQSLTAFSSNSPWVPASIAIKTAATSATGKTVYTGSTTKAFKQFAVVPTSSLPSTVTNTLNTSSAATTTTTTTMTNSSTDELIRTGEISTPIQTVLQVFGVLLGYLLIYFVVKTNKKAN